SAGVSEGGWRRLRLFPEILFDVARNYCSAPEPSILRQLRVVALSLALVTLAAGSLAEERQPPANGEIQKSICEQFAAAKNELHGVWLNEPSDLTASAVDQVSDAGKEVVRQMERAGVFASLRQRKATPGLPEKNPRQLDQQPDGACLHEIGGSLGRVCTA